MGFWGGDPAEFWVAETLRGTGADEIEIVDVGRNVGDGTCTGAAVARCGATAGRFCANTGDRLA